MSRSKSTTTMSRYTHLSFNWTLYLSHLLCNWSLEWINQFALHCTVQISIMTKPSCRHLPKIFWQDFQILYEKLKTQILIFDRDFLKPYARFLRSRLPLGRKQRLTSEIVYSFVIQGTFRRCDEVDSSRKISFNTEKVKNLWPLNSYGGIHSLEISKIG